ncbi:MAG: GDSL-type esterase/lipase family protein [Pseudomonadota bacterium]|nr:GDSL-type esterase/lipase family protein [Pseudomonadota bacterium]
MPVPAAPARMPGPAPRRGSPAFTFAVLLALCGALLGIAEGVARARWDADELDAIPSMPFLEDHPVLLWKQRPGLDTRLPEGPPLRTNRDGLRAGERTPKAGRARVLSLGESTTWGHSLPAEQSYTSLLATRLDAAGFDVDVVNAGQPAWSVWQSWRFLDTEGAAWEPDVVVLYHLQNDISSRGASNRVDPFSAALTDRELTEARAPFAAVSTALAKSRLRAAVWRFALAPRVSAQAPGGVSDRVRVPTADRTAALDAIGAWCAAHRARLLILHPVYGTPRPTFDALLPAWADANDAAFVHLQSLAAKDEAPPSFLLDDTHPTAAGHAWIAAHVAPALEGLLTAMGRAPAPAPALAP